MSTRLCKLLVTLLSSPATGHRLNSEIMCFCVGYLSWCDVLGLTFSLAILVLGNVRPVVLS